jgi:DNA-binding MarR family transcriptional regulator
MILPDLLKYQATWESARRYLGEDVRSVLAYLMVLRVGNDLEALSDPFFERYHLSQGRFAVLIRLFEESDGTLLPSQLAQSLGVTRATITKLVDGLERSGLVERHLDKTDRRTWLISVTAEARALLEEMLPPHFQRIKQMMDVLSKDEQQQLVHILLKLEEHLRMEWQRGGED